MRFGLQVYSFTWPGGPEAIGSTPARVVRSAESADQLVDRFGRLGDAGVQHVIINTADVHNPDAIELLATKVMPQLADSLSHP
jgi:hypothetical protein